MAIKLEHVNYIYGADTELSVAALKDVNLSIEDGQFIGLIGHTGSGKSTLVQHLNGLLKATSGAIYYNGKNIYDKDYNMKELRSKVGLVFQYPEHQLFEIDVFSDVCFGPKNLGLSKEEIQARAMEALELVGIGEEYYKQSPFDLSGGQKRRVAIAGVLAMKPDILCFDEPTSALDPELTGEVLKVIRGLAQQHTTMIIVTHEMAFARDVADQVIFMDGGVIVEQGPAREVIDNPQQERTRHFLARYSEQ